MTRQGTPGSINIALLLIIHYSLLVYLFTHLLIYSFTHLLIYSFTHLLHLLHLLISSMTCFVYLFTCLLVTLYSSHGNNFYTSFQLSFLAHHCISFSKLVYQPTSITLSSPSQFAGGLTFLKNLT